MATVAMKLQPLESAQSEVTEEAKAAFEYTCRYYLGIGPDEFLGLLDAGFYEKNTDSKVERVLAMLPFAR